MMIKKIEKREEKREKLFLSKKVLFVVFFIENFLLLGETQSEESNRNEKVDATKISRPKIFF